ncbi:YjcB family protein [Erwiniaceae bacterium BAC15a-03b]|uniref:YjcB family protein n=1 Tax=Winslowiella arboricola TaxID=2978220 RepID=A0A9J6PQH8_9GAMM|nr:YjcB family protein [Winslowiella arboricola]MCU5772585.1 YjcB family protein [Winslowiella arboricola]MCU5778619.1 YjcB family protein [Winslowiella arboricola]
MGTIAASVVLMRWELLSAVMMFFASTFKIKCRQSSRNAMAFVFSGVGIGMSCWFVTGLLGITLSAENLSYAWQVTKDVFIDVMSHQPDNILLP